MRDFWDSEERFGFESLLTDLLGRFVDLSPGQVDTEILDAERRVCQYLGLDISALWEWQTGHSAALIKAHLCNPTDFPPLPERMEASEHFPWCLRKLMAGELVLLSSTENVPAEAARDLETWRHFGIKTTLIIPLSASRQPAFGAISFSGTVSERVWAKPLVERLELLAKVFASAIVRKRTAQASFESDGRLDMAVEASGAGAWSMDAQSGNVWVSVSERRLFGFPADVPLTLDSFMHRIHPDDRESVRTAVEKSLLKNEPLLLEYRIVLPDGSVRWIVARGRPEFDAQGKPERLIGVSTDVTDHKQIEKAFRSYAARMEAAIELAGLGFFEMGENNRIAFLDQQSRKLFGITAEEDERARDYWLARVHPEDLPPVLRQVREVLEGGLNRSVLEYRYRHPSRGLLWLNHLSSVLERNAAGRATYLIGVIRDITERKQVEEKLCASEELNRATFEQASVGLAYVGIDGQWLRVNDKFCSIVGYTRDELMKLKFRDIAHAEDLENDHSRIRQILSGRVNSVSMETQYLRMDRSVVWINMTVSLIRTSSGEPAHLFAVVEDITARVRAEQALKQNEFRLASVIDIAQLGFYEEEGRSDDRLSFLDKRVGKIVGFPLEEGNRVREYWLERIYHDDQQRVFDLAQRFEMGELDHADFEYRYLHPERGLVWLRHLVHATAHDAEGRVVRLIGVLQDITERKQAEAALVDSRMQIAHLTRLTTMGELTMALAHELNQPLGAIMNNANAARLMIPSGLPDVEDFREILMDIIADAQRAGEVIRRVRGLVKKSELALESLNVNELIREAASIVHSDAIIKGVSLNLMLSPELPMIRSDRVQLIQVLLNLIVNAFDSMKDVSGERVLTVRTEFRPTDGVLVSLQDSGSGIPPDKIETIFDPFFSSKPGGMGMGLSICRTIITSLGGRIWAENNRDGGAVLQFNLPVDRASKS